MFYQMVKCNPPCTWRTCGTKSTLYPKIPTVSPDSTCPPGGTHTPGNVRKWAALLVSRICLSDVHNNVATPTSIPRCKVSSGILLWSLLSRSWTGQKEGCWWKTKFQKHSNLKSYNLWNILSYYRRNYQCKKEKCRFFHIL